MQKGLSHFAGSIQDFPDSKLPGEIRRFKASGWSRVCGHQRAGPSGLSCVPRGANFSRVQDAHTAPNKGNFICSTIMLNYFNREKRIGYIISIYKVIVMLLFC